MPEKDIENPRVSYRNAGKRIENGKDRRFHKSVEIAPGGISGRTAAESDRLDWAA